MKDIPSHIYVQTPFPGTMFFVPLDSDIEHTTREDDGSDVPFKFVGVEHVDGEAYNAYVLKDPDEGDDATA